VQSTTRSNVVYNGSKLQTGAKSAIYNKAVIDRRLRPLCCHLGSYFKRPKSSPVRPLACNWYYCAQFSQAQGCVCTALQLDGDVEQPWLMSKRANGTSSIKQEVHNVSLRRQKKTQPRLQATCKKIGEDRTCSSKDMIAERQTDRHGHQNTLFPYRGGVIIARSNLFIGHSMVFLEESLELP